MGDTTQLSAITVNPARPRIKIKLLPFNVITSLIYLEIPLGNFRFSQSVYYNILILSFIIIPL